MKIVRLYTGTDNESHFEDIDVELRVDGHMQMSALNRPMESCFVPRRRRI